MQDLAYAHTTHIYTIQSNQIFHTIYGVKIARLVIPCGLRALLRNMSHDENVKDLSERDYNTLNGLHSMSVSLTLSVYYVNLVI